ncbi:hypothetical protein QA601_09130 [Chitinispirillales bacterium ANBcel5]|uniref:hypothetical protein n=1 Tax=Cellulosispirillum alkaliphilum TaxID=3039283 RepID=UPI002A50CD90|nr:hypothetical protein [Chitinispirillales bacterium ANBcel5]
MKSRLNKSAVVYFFILVFSINNAKTAEVAFLGFRGDGAPQIEKTFERMLRERLSINPEFKTVDVATVESLVRRINFYHHDQLSFKELDSIHKYLSDSTLVAWTNITSCKFRPVRRQIIRKAIEGKLSVELGIYCLGHKRHIFSGLIEVTAEEMKGFHFFGSVEKKTHITATERTELLDRLVKKAVNELDRMIALTVRTTPPLPSPQDQSTEVTRTPTISDIFTMPSMESQPVAEEQEEPAVVQQQDEDPELPFIEADITPGE